MILYATASLAPNDIQTLRDVQPVNGYPHLLISYAYDEDATFFSDKLGYPATDRLGDSGAFTAWTTGKQVDLDGLIGWCRRNVEQHPDFTCISLDVIPGTAGGNAAPSRAERDRASEESLANGDAMRDAGLKIMEVFHVYEPLHHLDRLIERRQPGEVLGLGGMVGRSVALKEQFCDSVFDRIRQHVRTWDRMIPVHGLGLSVRGHLAARYPWWSIDSSSWLAPAKFGKHIAKGGKVGADDKRTGNRSVRHLYLTRVLEGWLDREHQLTSMWWERGVRWVP